jgi:tetratricopeptide (TPR) repeat protein
MSKQSFIHFPRYLAAALVLLTVGLYAQVATFSFTNYDDHFFVTENLMVQQGVSLHTLRWAFFDVSQGSWQPLTWLSHLLDYQLFGLSPAGHHLTSVLIHAINSALLGYVLTLYTGALWRSCLVAALFAVHPLHVESVAWIAERRDVLSGFWWLLCMWRYWVWHRDREWRNAVLLCVCFLGGLMSKPIVVTLPVILLVLDGWPLQRLPREGICQLWSCRSQIWPLVMEKAPLFAMAVMSGVVTIFAEEGQGNLGSFAAYPMSFRLGNAVLAYVRYLGKTCWPFSLLPFYPYAELVPWQVCAAGVLLVLITIFLIRLRGDHPYLLCGWLWYLLTLLPVIGIIQQGEFALADRYTYLPLIGIFIALVWGGAALRARFAWLRQSWLLVIAAFFVVVLSGLTVRQTSFWRDTPTLFIHTLDEDPGNFKALLQLGAYHRDRGEMEQARDYFLRVLQQLPRNREAVANLGDVYDKMGRYDEAEQYFQQALTIDPGYVQVYVNLGVMMAKQGNLPLAVTHFEKALALQPADSKLRINLGGALYLQGQFAAASAQFLSVLGTDKGSADAYNGLGLVLMAQGKFADAVHNFQQALQMDPLFQRAQENLEMAMAKMRGDQ